MKLMVIDGHSILNRSYYAIRPLTTREGLYVNGIYGFLTTYLRLMKEESPDAVCVAFDVHAPTFRHKADETYKSTRKPMPDPLRMQVPILKEVLDALNIPRCELSGWEADDLLGTLSRRCETLGWDCILVTGDRDSLQLITDTTRVKLITSSQGKSVTKEMTRETFRAEYGFEPIHMIDLKALMGDSSDNIPGVAGIGAMTAKALIQMYGSIDQLYAHMPDICSAPNKPAKPNVIKKLSAGEKDARHSYWLATIVTDAPLNFNPVEHLCQPPSENAYPLFLRLEFSKLIDKFQLSPPPLPEAQQMKPVPVVQITDTEQAERLLQQWRDADHVSVLALPDLSGIAVTCGAETAEAFFQHYQGDWNTLLAALFSDTIRKVSHNVKDLMRTLLENHLPADGFLFDTALAGYLLDATAGTYELQRLYLSRYNEALPEPAYLQPEAFSLLCDVAQGETSFASYVSAVETLYVPLRNELEARDALSLYRTAELPLCRVLAEMEHTGCRVDANALSDFGALLEKQAQTLQQSIYDMAGGAFNLNSPRQLGTVLFEQLGLPHGKKTKSGWSTSADVLEKLRYEAPIVNAVLEYRQYAKLKSTYADGLLKAIRSDGRIHTHFQMTATATGRLSSTDPNLQNIPTRTDLGSEFRRMFIPDAGNVLVDADYSQIELRLLAHISGDTAMQQAFMAGGDFHAATAAAVFHVKPSEVTSEMRRRAKAVNFGIVYGISPFSLAQDLELSVVDAKRYMEAWFAAFPDVHQYMTDIVEQAKRDGFVETIFHRRRDLPELQSSKYSTRSFGERVALNMPIQGTAADIMKMAMVSVRQRLQEELPSAQLVLQIHDELLVECPEESAADAAAILRQTMEHVTPLSVPLTVDIHWGENWQVAKH